LALLWISGFKSGPILILLDFTIILAFALVFGNMMKMLHQPAVLGEILGGIILGPTIFGTIAPGLQSELFPTSGEPAQILRAVAYLGLIAFVFVAGLEVDLTCIKRRSKSTMITSISGIVLPFALGFGMVVLVPGIWGIPSGDLRIFALFMGTALSISALPVIARILMDLGLLKTELGAMIITAATIDDLVGWSLFALILSSLNSGTSIGLNLGLTLGFFGLLAFIIYLSNKNTARLQSPLMGGLLDIIAMVMLAESIISEFIGAHGIFGAFLAGAILSQRRERRNQILRKVYYPVIGILAPIYFASIGLKANFATNFDLTIVLLVFVAACAGKIIGASIGARASGVSLRDSLAIGFGLNARGAMEIVLASVALDYGLIDERIFVALVVMAFATTMIGGSMIQRLIISKVFSEERKIETSTALY
jgi:Kef-type K+ transport system membrane component KefB